MKKILLFFGSILGLLVTPKVEYLWGQIKVYIYTGMVRRRYKHFGNRTFLQLDVKSLVNENGVIYDVKGFLTRDIIDGRL